MRSWHIPPNVGKIQIECDKESPFIADSFPYGRIAPSGQTLVINAIRIMAGVSQQLNMSAAQIFVEFQDHELSGAGESLLHESKLRRTRSRPGHHPR
jgi:hypothetical protein